ncbi:unnamed protein product [Dibothriocephalus latus]|uniref:C2H2-type domain-containing protein n=1 Tax=Dibothriocephalus latus TaxID=60516 RepID=A0A3P7M877_DIBLA|nr:unnamed protein product [Dibothriocephalus latus]
MTNKCHSTDDNSDDIEEIEELSLCCLCGQTFPNPESLHEHFTVAHEGRALLRLPATDRSL